MSSIRLVSEVSFHPTQRPHSTAETYHQFNTTESYHQHTLREPSGEQLGELRQEPPGEPLGESLEEPPETVECCLPKVAESDRVERTIPMKLKDTEEKLSIFVCLKGVVYVEKCVEAKSVVSHCDIATQTKPRRRIQVPKCSEWLGS